MSGYLTFLIVIAVLIAIELSLRLVGSSLSVLTILIQKLITYSNNYPGEFAGKTVATIISILLIVLGWCIIFKLPGAIDGYATFTNITFIVIFSIGIITALGAFIWDKVTSIRDPTNPNQLPVFPGTPWDRLRYFFVDIPVWLFQNNIGSSVFKVLIGIAFFFALIIGFITLLAKYPTLSKGIFVTLQITLTLGLLGVIYGIIQNNPQIRELITESFIFRFIYNIIFAIPCLFYMFVNGTYEEAINTPKSVYIVLAIEILIILLYIASLYSEKAYEFIYDKLFLTKTDLDYAKQTALPGILRKLNSKKEEYQSMTSSLSVLGQMKDAFLQWAERATTPKDKRKDVIPKNSGLYLSDWDEIIQKKLYSKDNESILRNLLIKEGFRSKKDSDFNPQLDKDIDDAISYIQANGGKISKLSEEIKDLEQKVKDITDKKDKDKNEYSIEDSKILLNKPKYLDKKIDIGDFENLKTSSPLHNHNYCISAWIFLHEEPTNYKLSSTRYTPILDYADNPKFSYNLEKHMFRITIKDTSGSDILSNYKVIYQTDKLPMQRWNNIVVNFSGGTLDIFINSMLVATVDKIIPHMDHDVIYSGEKNGMGGGICNVTYFSSPLTKGKIQFLYNSFKNKNPPII
jgi:hypothetical protein